MAKALHAPRTHDERLSIFTLGTFHTAIFLITAVLVLHLTGVLVGLLTGLNTLAGLALFAALWATTTWSTGRAVPPAPVTNFSVNAPIGRLLLRAVRAGALNGVLFLASAAVILALSAVLTGQGQSILVFIFGGLVFVTVGTLVAGTIGAIIGGLFAAIDLVLIGLARQLLKV
jgi:hypothetical protein